MFISFVFYPSSPVQGLITGALAELYENEEDTHKGTVCLKEMAARIAMVFVSLKVHIYDDSFIIFLLAIL